MNANRDRLLAELRDGGCEHTGNLARDLDIAPGTALYHLYRLEDASLVRGVKHDERDTLHHGRRRIYWSPVEESP